MVISLALQKNTLPAHKKKKKKIAYKEIIEECCDIIVFMTVTRNTVNDVSENIFGDYTSTDGASCCYQGDCNHFYSLSSLVS